MKYWLHLLIILLVGFFLGQWAIWWSISILAVVSAFLLKSKPWLSGAYGFLAGFLLFCGLATYLDIENQHILSSKIGSLFSDAPPVGLLVLTGIIGGILAALGSLIGSTLRISLSSNK